MQSNHDNNIVSGGRNYLILKSRLLFKYKSKSSVCCPIDVVTMVYRNKATDNKSSSNIVSNEGSLKVIIFDWDDTICPSSFFDRHQIENINELPTKFRPLFCQVALAAEKCLKEASKYGEVIIITNSDDGWVKYSCERIVPSLLPVLSQYRIVSARTNYEKFYPNQPLCWKAAAFAHEVNELFEDASASVLQDNNSNTGSSTEDAIVTSDQTDGNTSPCPSLELSVVSTDDSIEEDATMTDNVESEISIRSVDRREVISFGDSMEERTAVRIVADQLTAIPKSVMFVQSPTPLHIIGQLHMLRNHMKFVCQNDDSLDLEISPDQAQQFAKSYFTSQLKNVKDAENIVLLSKELTELVRSRRRRSTSFSLSDESDLE